MNQKQCKKIRKNMTLAGQDWKETEYKEVSFHTKESPFPHIVSDPVVLTDCGRKLYKQFKSLVM